MIERFQGDEGRARLVRSLLDHRLVANEADLATHLTGIGELIEVQAGEVFIRQDEFETYVFFIVAGSAEVRVNNKVIANRFPGEHVGEMSAIEPIHPRAATLITREPTVLLKVSEADFTAMANRFPQVWRRVAATLARRLHQRNHLVTVQRERVRVFIMSSVEALPIADLIIQEFAYDPFLAVAWKHGVFKASNYTLDDLEAELDDSDFAIAIAHQDDVVISRNDTWPAMRDNVVFELGLFMGRLGRRRAFLMEPRDGELRLPSDLAGLTTIPYRYAPGKDARAAIAPACARLRELILASGAKD